MAGLVDPHALRTLHRDLSIGQRVTVLDEQGQFVASLTIVGRKGQRVKCLLEAPANVRLQQDDPALKAVTVAQREAVEAPSKSALRRAR